ncbi:uncharacterized protein METZ01_LOCUS70500, partial [marine metagenome]
MVVRLQIVLQSKAPQGIGTLEVEVSSGPELSQPPPLPHQKYPKPQAQRKEVSSGPELSQPPPLPHQKYP